MKKEIFKKIPGFEDYQISKNGKIISSKRDKKEFLKPSTGDGDYKIIRLYKDGKGKSFILGRLVLMAFIGICPEGMEASHLNGNPLDDRLENLCWETHQENNNRKIEHGTNKYARGEKNGNAKLTENQVIQIRKMIAQGYIQGYIAGIFDVNKSNISHIKCGRYWSHINL